MAHRILLLLICSSSALSAAAAVAAAGAADADDASLLPAQQQASGQHHHRQRLSRQLLQEAEAAAAGNDSSPVYRAWVEDAADHTRGSQGSCFQDFPGFIAKDITEFVRLIKDPAATHIELKGNIVFTHDFFPPDNAHNQAKGINVTHRVTIRACTSVQDPIIVDVNNLLQQIYVYGQMTWQGSIRFINSFPWPRRAGLFPLISILSVEGDGVIAFKGLHIHGNEPSPLFKPDDPFWQVYQNDSEFAPQPSMYRRIDDNSLVLKNWTFNKTAWVLASQGKNGVVRPVGDAVWWWHDVLVSWSAPPASASSGLQGSALALAVSLSVVFGVLLIAAGAVLAWWCRRRRHRARMAADATLSDKSGSMMQHAGAPSKPGGGSTVGGQQPSTYTMGGLQPSSYTLGSTSECNRMESSNASMATTQLIEQARRRMQETSGTREGSIVLDSLLGEGTFGKVYAATWKGTLVAVKTMLLPAAMSGKERREKMAIMETAISSSLSHPNIVQTYTYEVKPLTGELARRAMERRPSTTTGDTSSAFTFLDDTASNTDNHGWELRLVLEMCDVGNLKEFLGRSGFRLPDGQHDMLAIVATALDIARAMHHLHTENIIHSDLKARNVLLKSAGGDARGFVAKVSDFGLSMRIDPTETHVSNFYQGTLTHMAPEVLMYGKLSFTSDVYAFGIILWEMFTAQQAFKGVPRALLGHEVTKLGRRPEFPPNCPFDYQLLACRCWESDPAIRPTFKQILEDLERMKAKLLQARSADSSSSAPNSLPMHPALLTGVTGGAARPPSTTNSAAGGDAAAALLPLISASGAAAAAAAGSGALAGRQLASPDSGNDAGKYHHWEPQTSLLELGSMAGGSTTLDAATQQQWRLQAGPYGAAAAASGAGSAGVQAHSTPPSSSQQLGNVSLGTWDAPSGGGLWLSGSLAPVGLPSGVQLGALSQQQQAAAAAAGMQPAGSAGGSSSGVYYQDHSSTLLDAAGDGNNKGSPPPPAAR